MRWRRLAAAAPAAIAAVLLTGCFDVQSPDLFLLTRTSNGHKLTLLVNNSGTISCNGGKAKPISSSALIQARDLSDDLANDASAKLSIPATPSTVNYFKIKLEQGTVEFPDRAAQGHKPLAEAELFALQAAQTECGLNG